MFGKVHGWSWWWRFEQRTFYTSSFRVTINLACQVAVNWVWPSMNGNRLLFIYSKHYLQACTTNGGNYWFCMQIQPMENHQEPTPNENSQWTWLCKTHKLYLGKNCSCKLQTGLQSFWHNLELSHPSNNCITTLYIISAAKFSNINWLVPYRSNRIGDPSKHVQTIWYNVPVCSIHQMSYLVQLLEIRQELPKLHFVLFISCLIVNQMK
jgi:hypothetical protein